MLKKPIFKSLTTTALIVAMSMTPLVASAAMYGCDHLWKEVGFSHEIRWISADEHEVKDTATYLCTQCGDEYTEENNYKEGHFYTYDYDHRAWFCECGDSFTNP